VDGTSSFFVIKEMAAALVLLAAAFSTPAQADAELVRLIGLEAATNGGCGDDGWNLPSATAGDKVARQTALRRARDEVGSLSRWSILSRLQAHKLVASTQLALNHNDLPGLRLAYTIYIGKALDAYTTQVAAATRSWDFPGCVSKTTLTSFNATNQVLSLCNKHTQSASEFVADCFPTWANDCEDFRLSVGRHITYRAEQLMMCRVCDAPTPNWKMVADWCCCESHAKQVQEWARAKSMGICDSWTHPHMKLLVERALEAVQDGYAKDRKRCACCGQDGTLDSS
jgi:hypothetical protein